MKLKVSDYARLMRISTTGVYKQGQRKAITIEPKTHIAPALVVLTESDYEAKKAAYKAKNNHQFKI